MADFAETDTSASARAHRNSMLAEHLERTAQLLRQEFPEHGDADLEQARAEVAAEMRAAAQLLLPIEVDGEPTEDWPEFSTTELIIHGIDPEMKADELAWILGGGQWVRMIRLAPGMAFVSYWTNKGQLRGLKDGVEWIRNETWTAYLTEKARFNPRYHQYEVDPEAPYPPYRVFATRDGARYDDTGDWATSTSTTTSTTSSWQSGEASGAFGSANWTQRTNPGTTRKRARKETPEPLQTIEE